MDIFCNRVSHTISAAAEASWHAKTRSSRLMRLAVLAVAVSAIAVVTASEAAFASGKGDLKAYGTEVSKKTNVITDIVSYICYIGGAILSALGVVDLKKHVENPSQTPMKNGLAKLGFGGVLLSLPFVSGVMAGTMAGSGDNATFVKFKDPGTI